MHPSLIIIIVKHICTCQEASTTVDEKRIKDYDIIEFNDLVTVRK